MRTHLVLLAGVFTFSGSALARESAKPSSVDIQKVLELVADKQAEIETIQVEFAALVEGVPERLGETTIAERKTVRGEIVWLRDGSAEKLELEFDLPSKLKYHPFAERTRYHDGQRQVIHFPDSGSVLIDNAKVLSVLPSPADVLMFGLRRDVRQLAEKGAIVGVAERDGLVHLEVDVPWVSGGVRVNATADPELDYAIVAWDCPVRHQSATIRWQRNDSGEVVPAEMEWTEGTAPNQQRWTFQATNVSTRPPAPGALVFRPQPGMLVTDSTVKGKDGKASVYQIDAHGNRVPVLALQMTPTPVPTAARVSIGAGLLALVCVVGWARCRLIAR